MIATEDITVRSCPGGSPRLTGVLARPATGGRWPAVVMVHEAWGIDEVLRRQAVRLATVGYLVLAPDLYSAGGRLRCRVATFRAMSAGHGRAFADIDACRRYLDASPSCTGNIGIIGFCLGGGFALVAATGPASEARETGAADTPGSYDVAAVNYGRLSDGYDALAPGSCPVVASYGGRDKGLAGVAARLEASLTSAGVDHDVQEYPQAGHAFLNDAPNGPWALRPLLRIAGAGPEPAAAADAWARIETFFARYLDPDEPA